MGTATTDRPQQVENIKVLQVGAYGVRVDEKLWFGVNKPLTPDNFAVGTGYKVSVVVSKTGKKYINSILGVEAGDAAPADTAKSQAPAQEDPSVKAAEEALKKAKATAEAKAKEAQAGSSKTGNPSRAGFGQPLTDYDMAKDRQIGRAGVVQAAMQSGAALQWAGNIDEYLSNVRKIADFGMKYAQE